MRSEDTRRIACPSCRAGVTYRGALSAGRLDRGALVCEGCEARWPVEGGLPRLCREEEMGRTERLLQLFYDGVPSLHNPAVRLLLPLFQAGTEEAMRHATMQRLDLGALRPREDGQPVRILEIGIGAGANLRFLDRHLPPGLEVEVWGPDISGGMLRQCQKLLARRGRSDVRLLFGDAHALPFRDGAFDRVFHVGATNSFRDPKKALAEMARVAAPGTPIVVVDEQLDRRRENNLYHRATFRLITFYDRSPRCPTDLLPGGASDVIEEQLNRFIYCLTFRMPSTPLTHGPGATRCPAGLASSRR